MTVATNLLEKWFWIFGNPVKFLSEKGKEFRLRVLEDLCSLLGIQRLNTMPGHPQFDGLSEKKKPTSKSEKKNQQVKVKKKTNK